MLRFSMLGQQVLLATRCSYRHQPAHIPDISGQLSYRLIASPRWIGSSASSWNTGSKYSAGASRPDGSGLELDPLQDQSQGLVQRFRNTIKQYGKVLLPVHVVTSAVWISCFYCAAVNGVNVVPVLEYIPGFPERILSLLENSQSGHALTTYTLYKISTPARYTITLGGTSMAVKYLRRHGYISTPPPVKEYIQDKMEETRGRLSDKMEETRGRLSDKMEATRGRLSDKMEATKERLSGGLEETKDKVNLRKKKEDKRN